MVLSLEHIQIPKVFLAQHSMLLNVIYKLLHNADDVIRGHDVITHAQMIMCDSVGIVPPRDFGTHYIGITKFRKLTNTIFISLKWHNAHKTVTKIHPASLNLLHE
jgi:hypothetical protein